MKVGDYVLLRVLAVIVLVAAGIRLVFWLLAPVWPYLLATLLFGVLVWIVWWYRERW